MTGNPSSHANLKTPMRFSMVLLAALTCLPLFAQQTGISGRVGDPSKAAIANVIVTATGEDGTKVATTTNSAGLYQFPGLRAGSYRLRFEVSGFTPAERTLDLLVGTVATVDLELLLSKTSSTVNVEATAVAVDTSNSNVSGDVSPTEVSKIPLNGRNYLGLAMMVPGITSNDVQNSPLGSTDSGKMQINVDGQQVTQNSAGTSFGQPIFSDDAIDQYQIITNRFDATMGRSSRLQVIVQTKSGTNAFHGTLFGYFRNSDFNAADPVAHKVLPFSDQQFGGTVGGPIIKNKLFFFFSYEGERQPLTSVDSPTDYLNTAGQQITFNFPNSYNTRAYLLHMDWQAGTKQRLSVRASGSTWAIPFDGVAGTVSPQAEYAATRTFYAVAGTWTSILTPALVNEAKIGFNHYSWSNTPLLQTMGFQSLDGNSWGAPYNYPQTLGQNNIQFRDDLFWLKGNHSFKFGADYQHLPYSGNFGQYVRGVATGFNSAVTTNVSLINVFPVWNQPSTWNVALLDPYVTTFVQGFGSFVYNIPTNNMGAWAQDDWKVNRKLTLNLGVRYDNDLGIFNPNLHLTGTGAPATPHYNQNFLFQPRFGFTYDPTGSRKTVIRGGAGLFYADIQANQTIDGQIFNGQTTLSPSLSPTAANPINLLLSPNPFGYTSTQVLSGQVPVSIQSIQPLGPNVRTPYSLQVSGGVEHQFAKNWSFSADFVHFRIYHDWVREDANLFENVATGYAQNPTSGRPDPSYSNIKNFVTPNAAGSIYNALQVAVQHRFSEKFSTQVAYTLSHLKDSTTGPFYYPNNQFNLAGEWGPSPDNQTNTLTLAGTYSIWKGIALSGQLHYGSGQNFQVLSTATPLGLSGVVDNRLVPTSTPTFISPTCLSAAPGFPGENIVSRDCLVGNPIVRLDMRLSKTFTIKDRFRFIPMIEAFNLLNHSNFGSYQTSINVASFGQPAQVTTIGDLTYQPRMLQFAGRFEF